MVVSQNPTLILRVLHIWQPFEGLPQYTMVTRSVHSFAEEVLFVLETKYLPSFLMIRHPKRKTWIKVELR